jgi:hypothetical protein
MKRPYLINSEKTCEILQVQKMLQEHFCHANLHQTYVHTCKEVKKITHFKAIIVS